MKNLRLQLLTLVATFLMVLNVNAQPPSGAAYPVVERATFSATAPCSVCTPWQYVQTDSTLRRYIGSAWVTYYNPSTITSLVNAVANSAVTNLTTSLNPTTVTINSSSGTDAAIPSAQVSSAGVMSAADKTKLDALYPGVYDNLSSGNLVVTVYRKGPTATTLTVNSTGDYSLIVPTNTFVENIFVHGDNTTLTGGSFIFRINGSADSRNYRMGTQMYNTANGALVNVFVQGNNHTRTLSGNIVTDTYPNMSPYSTTGFDILYR
jgi:hypothetical protein